MNRPRSLLRYPRDGFATVETARVWVAAFVAWYNDEHKHSGIGFVSPADRDVKILAARRALYEQERVTSCSRPRRAGETARDFGSALA